MVLTMKMVDNPQDSDAAIATNHWPYPEVPASLPNPEATATLVHKKSEK